MTRILVVDDDPTTQRLLKIALNADGHDVTLASDGLEALAQHEQEPADVIVLDIVMPGIDGFEVIQRIRATGDQVPVLFLSGLSRLKDRLNGFSLGADDYMTKPYSVSELRLRVKGLLRFAGARWASFDQRVGQVV
jgi:DNA-binding response OmpR family regulator